MTSAESAFIRNPRSSAIRVHPRPSAAQKQKSPEGHLACRALVIQ
jgi:hypothetical protein